MSTTETATEERFAIVTGLGATPEAIAAYLPANYHVVAPEESGPVMIAGYDNAGWTLDDYVIPRLASGLYYAEEVK